MKRRVWTVAAVVLLCGLICPASYADPPAEKDPLATLAKKLADRLVANKRARVTVLDFTDIQNRPNEFGRYLSLQLANELVNLPDVSVLDRANIATIMAEHKLTAEGLLKPEEAKKLGQFAGVEAILIGNVSLIGQNMEVMVRAISTETSEIVASGKAAIPATDESRRMLGLAVVEGGSAGSGNSAGATATEGPAIATSEVGPITAILRNVVEYSVPSEKGAVPLISCTFDLENRNLQRSVAVSVTQSASGKEWGERICPYRAGLIDSNQLVWRLKNVSGISAVVCFETDRWGRTRQENPGGIVDYIRTAKKYDYDIKSLQEVGRFWSGSFGSIPPGKKIRMTADFLPDQTPNGDGRARTSYSRPGHFMVEMELVLATYGEGEDPAKAKDLMLRTLTIDRVVLAKQPAAAKP